VDRPSTTQRIARRLFGPHRHEHPEAQAVVRILLAGDPRFIETHEGRWSARGADHVRVKLENATYTVVDLETTGSQIGVDEIIEIGVVVIRSGKVRRRFSTLVQTGRRVPPWVQNLTGIRTVDLKNAPALTELAPELTSLLQDSVFVAHDIRFDLPFLRWEFASRDLPMPRVVGLCTLCLSRDLWPQLPSRSLKDLAQHFGVPHQHPHRADNDAAATAGILRQALVRVKHLGLAEIGDLFQIPNGRTQSGPLEVPPFAAEAAD
jgi:DNA polymerase III epsilon subunit family exonuclease